MNSFFKFGRVLSTSGASFMRQVNRPLVNQGASFRLFSDNSDSKMPNKKVSDVKSSVVGTRFEAYSEETAPIIFDIEEERERLKNFEEVDTRHQAEAGLDLYEGINLNRGVRGVFDIEDLVEVLRRDNIEDIFVCCVPVEYKYVDYICLATARSPRHMKAIIEFVRKLYKLKRSNKDLIPRTEGKDSKEWIALDLGNIALHVMLSETREKYDLETLWAVGWQFDDESNKSDDPLIEIYERHMNFLDDLTPSEGHKNDATKSESNKT